MKILAPVTNKQNQITLHQKCQKNQWKFHNMIQVVNKIKTLILEHRLIMQDKQTLWMIFSEEDLVGTIKEIFLSLLHLKQIQICLEGLQKVLLLKHLLSSQISLRCNQLIFSMVLVMALVALQLLLKNKSNLNLRMILVTSEIFKEVEEIVTLVLLVLIINNQLLNQNNRQVVSTYLMINQLDKPVKVSMI